MNNRLLFIFPTLHPGGAEKAAILVANELVERHSYNISFFVFDDSDYYLPVIHPSITIIRSGRSINGSSRIIRLLQYYILFGFDLIRLVDVRRYDRIVSIHEQVPEIAAFWLWLFHLLKGSNIKERCISIVPTSLIGIQHERGHIASRLLFLCLRLFRRLAFRTVIVLSESSYKNITEHHPSITIIPNFIDSQKIEQFAAEPVAEKNGIKPYLLFLARITAQKKPMELLKAYHRIHKNVSYDLYMIGHVADTLLYRSLVQYINDHGLQRRVVIYDTVINPYPYIRQALGVILVSNYEGMGLTLFEAMALKVPAISTKYEGYESFLHDDICTLIDRNSANDLEDTLLRLETDYASFTQKTERAYQYCSLFNKDSIVEKYHQLFSNAGAG